MTTHYTAEIRWHRGEARFTDHRYSRRHVWHFDGGVEVPASASPEHVRIPLSDPAAVDPEEAFIAALSSCHMLFFLDIAAQRGFCVDEYVDAATGMTEADPEGRVAMTVVTLHPAVTFSGEATPDHDELMAIHHHAHDACYIANSVRTEVRCEPPFSD